MGARVEAARVVVVELAHKKRRDVSVTVVRTMVVVDWHPVPIPSRYIVTTTTGYRAEFEACGRDLCLDGTFAPCTCRGQRAHGSTGRWLTHSRRRCHCWHDEKITEFAKTVLKTYDPSSKRLTVGGVERGSYLPREYATCPSWPVEKTPVKGGVYFSDGWNRPLDYGFDTNAMIEQESHN